MSLSYTLRESFSGFRRARLSMGFAVVTLWIALVLLGLFAIVSFNTQKLVQSLRDRVEMEAFLREPVTTQDLHRIERTIRSDPGVDTIQYVSKDEAARVFEREFGDNVYRVMNSNPLPPSIKIFLKSGYKTPDRAKELNTRISTIAGVDTVVYRKRLLEIIDTRVSALNNVTLGLGVFIMVSAILLVANTIRLAIYAKRHIIRTMELVGATAMFSRWPRLPPPLPAMSIGPIRHPNGIPPCPPAMNCTRT